MPQTLNPALIGQLVVVLLLIVVVWTVFREVTRVALKILIPAALVMGVAVWLGFLDETVAGDLLTTLGEGVITGVRVVADWVAAAAFAA